MREVDLNELRFMTYIFDDRLTAHAGMAFNHTGPKAYKMLSAVHLELIA